MLLNEAKEILINNGYSLTEGYSKDNLKENQFFSELTLP